MAVNLGSAVGYLDLDTSKFVKGFKDAKSAVDDFKKESQGLTGTLSAVGQGVSSAGKDMTLKLTTPLVGLGTAAVTASASLEKGLSKVKAISKASADDMANLKDKAIEMGAKTKFSASEAADAFTYMAMAGWDANEMMAGIDGIMNLAAADGLDLATTSDIVTDALTAFGLSAGDAGTFADVLATASSSANTNVSMLGESFKYVAPVAGALGYSVQDTATALGLMANNGVKAGQAGTTLRTALSRMVKPTDDVAEAMEKYNISLINQDGSMKSLDEVMTTLRENLGNLSKDEQTQAATTLFGQEAMSGMLAIIRTSNEDYDSLSSAINNSKDAAEDMANTMIDNLSGQLTILKSTLESLAISFGDLLLPALKDVVSGLQSAVEWLNNLDEPTKQMIIKVAAVVAAIGPLLVILGSVFKQVSTVIQLFKLLKLGIAAVASPVGVIVVALGALVVAFVTLWNKSEKFRNFWINLWNGLKSTVGKIINGIVTFFTKTIPEGFEKALTKIREFPANFVNFLKNLPYNLGVIIGKLLAKVVTFAIEFPAKAKAAAKEFKEKLIAGIKALPGKIKSKLTEVGNKAVSFAKDFPKKAKEAAKNFKEKLVEGLKKIPKKMKEIGKDIIDGVVNGFNDAIENAKEAVSDFGQGIVDGFKSFFDIHSPSKKMKKEIGVQVANGVIDGITSKTDAAKKSAAELSEEIVNAASDKLSILKQYNKISVVEEVKYWKEILNNTKEGTDANLLAYKNYEEAVQSLNAEKLSNAESTLDELKTYNEISTAGEVSYWADVLSTLDVGSTQYLTAYKNYLSAKETYDSQLKEAETNYNDSVSAVYDSLKEKVDALTKSYKDQVKARKEALLASFNIFEEYTVDTENAKSKDDLTGALQSQVDALSTYKDQLSALEERGILPKSLLSNLKDMGLDATTELQTLNSMTDSELKKYVKLWKQRNKLAKEEAERENEEEYEKLQTNIEKANQSAIKKVDKLNKTYTKKLAELRDDAYSNAKSTGKKLSQGIGDGITAKKSSITSAFDGIMNDINSYMAKIASSLSSAQSSADKISKLSSTSKSGSKKSHRQGLTYVPYDGYEAVLHEGEKVLTKEEAAKSSDGNGDTYVFYSPKAIDEKEAARQMKLMKQQLALGY